MSLIPNICFFCEKELSFTIFYSEFSCKDCRASDGTPRHIVRLENGKITLIQLYFFDQNIGIYINVTENNTTIFEYKDVRMDHNNQIKLDYIREIDFSNSETILQQLEMFRVFS